MCAAQNTSSPDIGANFISFYITFCKVYDVKRQSEILPSLQSLQRTTARKVSTSSDKYMQMSTADFLLSCIPRSLFREIAWEQQQMIMTSAF